MLDSKKFRGPGFVLEVDSLLVEDFEDKIARWGGSLTLDAAQRLFSIAQDQRFCTLSLLQVGAVLPAQLRLTVVLRRLSGVADRSIQPSCASRSLLGLSNNLRSPRPSACHIATYRMASRSSRSCQVAAAAATGLPRRATARAAAAAVGPQAAVSWGRGAAGSVACLARSLQLLRAAAQTPLLPPMRWSAGCQATAHHQPR